VKCCKDPLVDVDLLTWGVYKCDNCGLETDLAQKSEVELFIDEVNRLGRQPAEAAVISAQKHSTVAGGL